MRELKFRGKHIEGGEWVYGFVVKTDKQTVIVKDIGGFYWPVDPETVGQFTERHDKNGKDVFEGDIIEGGLLGPSYIKWSEKLLGWSLVCFLPVGIEYNLCEEGEIQIYEIDFADVEIIGNIHENPELLK
jgi:hypothetical protein